VAYIIFDIMMRSSLPFAMGCIDFGVGLVGDLLVGLLFGVGYLYKTKQVESTDSILMFILAQILGSWVGLTNKIFRITTIASEKNPE
jgi:NhaP-type Na+/H+ or K+/H+ antiporter